MLESESASDSAIAKGAGKQVALQGGVELKQKGKAGKGAHLHV